MGYGLLADAVVVLHAGFVGFAGLGGLASLRWRRLAWLHVPAVLWAAAVELGGWVCPLTPLELWLRGRAGARGEPSGFLEHYLAPLLYPQGLTREIQVGLGLLVLAGNAALYAWLLWRRRQELDRRATKISEGESAR